MKRDFFFYVPTTWGEMALAGEGKRFEGLGAPDVFQN